MAGSGEKWRWADPQGVQRVIHSDELRAALASGALPPYTLVWRTGMREWLPAYQAAELATIAISAQQGLIPNIPPPPLAIVAVQAEFEHRVAAFTDKKNGEAGTDPEPPPPPVHQYPAIQAAVPPHIKRASQAAVPTAAPVVVPTPAPAPAAPAPAPALAPATASTIPTAPAPPAEKPSQSEPSPKPPVVVARSQPAAPKPPITVPPRATPSVVPPAPPDAAPASAQPKRVQAPIPLAQAKRVDAPIPFVQPKVIESPPAEPSPRPPSTQPVNVAAPLISEPPQTGSLPPLPGAVRSAPPPPPSRRPQLAPQPQAGRGAIPLPHAPLPLAPPPKALFDVEAALVSSTAGSLVPGAMGPAHVVAGNGGATPPPSSAGTPSRALASGATPTPPGFPSFPLEEIQSNDLVEDDESVELPYDRSFSSKVVDGLRDARNSLGPIAARAKKGLSPLAGRTKDSLSPIAGRAQRWIATKVAPPIERGWAYVKANPKDPKVLLALGTAAFFVFLLLIVIAAASTGKISSKGGAEQAPKSPSSEAPASTAANVVEPAVAIEHKPVQAPACHLSKEAARLAGNASKDVPLELTVGASGDRARVGFATSAGLAQGLAVDLASLTATPEFSAAAQGKIRGVVPVTVDGKPSYAVNGDAAGDKLLAWRTLGDSSLIVGWSEGSIAAASKSSDAPATLWRLDGDEMPDAIRGAVMGDQGQAVVFRRHGEIFVGALDADRKPRGNLVKVTGAGRAPGSPVGTPAVAANGTALAVAFADRASSSDPWGIWIGSAPHGSLPEKTSAFDVPPGGPGRTAFAPALSGLADGRWLLVWTEGSGGDHDVRAQTLDADLRPSGAAFTVSHEGGNAGQGAVALQGGRGIVAYLALTDRGYEMWGAAVDCR